MAMETRLAAPHPSDVHDRALFRGLGLVLLGVLAVSLSVASSIMTVFLLGLSLVLGGAVVSFEANVRRRARNGLAQFLSAAVLVCVGLVFILRPVSSLKVMTPLLLALFVADGVILIVTGLRHRDDIWLTRAATGGVILALGIALASRWRTAGLGLAGTLIGIHLISRGVMLVSASFAARALLRRGGAG
jgi:uncharacterized membrane protein HdeD (DUF308 family)